jgi:predicted lysophospholipase L1 biosynthesis ABC-type transport system permease subunit
LSREPATIVGVVGDVPTERLDRADGGHLYWSLHQRGDRAITLVVRTDENPTSLAGDLRALVRDVDPRMPVTRLGALSDHVGDSLRGPRLSLVLLVIFGSVAATLAAVGVYGVLSYVVARQTREIGTRVALGASPGQVLGVVLRQALAFWGVGVALGAVGAVLAVRALQSVVVDLQVSHVSAYVAVPLLLGVVTVVAALVPARRATSIDPTRALQGE